MEPLRICFISREYPPLSHTGGIGTYAHVAAEGLARRGHCVHVICVGPGESHEVSPAGAFVHRIQIHPFLLPAGRLWYSLRAVARQLAFSYLDNQAWSYGAAAFLRPLAAHEDLRVIEYAETNAEGFYSMQSSALARVCRLHIGGWSESASNVRKDLLAARLTYRLERRSILSAHRITSPSRALADLTAKTLGIDHNQIRVYPNPLDLEFTGNAAAPRKQFEGRILFVGRIERRKGTDLLLGAFINLLARFPQSRLRIVGQDYGYYFDQKKGVDQLRQLIEEYGIADKVEFLPRMDRPRLIEQYAWADVVVVPSINENLPYVVLEALSQFRPVVASDCGGIPEIVQDGTTGILFATGDISGLTSALVRLWENPAMATALGQEAGIQIRRRYSLEGLLPKMEQAYYEAMEESRESPVMSRK